jgi:site-specific recombinase XerD
VSQAAQASLTTWRDRFRSQFAVDEDAAWLFFGANGGRLAVDALEQMVKKAGSKAGITGLHPHRFRHTFATRFLTENLGDTFQLQQLLGHTSLEMVRRYVSLASMEKVIIERRASSIDRLLSSAAAASTTYSATEADTL